MLIRPFIFRQQCSQRFWFIFPIYKILNFCVFFLSFFLKTFFFSVSVSIKYTRAFDAQKLAISFCLLYGACKWCCTAAIYQTTHANRWAVIIISNRNTIEAHEKKKILNRIQFQSKAGWKNFLFLNVKTWKVCGLFVTDSFSEVMEKYVVNGNKSLFN